MNALLENRLAPNLCGNAAICVNDPPGNLKKRMDGYAIYARPLFEIVRLRVGTASDSPAKASQ